MIGRSLPIAACVLGLVATAAWAGAAEDTLLQAVQDGDRAEVKTALAQHADVNVTRRDKAGALLLAVDHQDPEVVRMLLAAKAQPNARDEDGISPLLRGCELGDPDIVQQLLQAGANASDVRPDGISAAALCAGSTTPEAMARLIASGADIKKASAKGQTPIMWAASRGNVGNVALLVKNGANINQASNAGFTPLFFAVKSAVPGAAKALLAQGADAKYVSPTGDTALELALLQKDFDLATALVNAGANINLWDINGKQPLHIASAEGATDFAKLLLAKGADPNALTKQAYRVRPTGSPRDRQTKWPANDPTVRVELRHRADGAGPAPARAAETALLIAARNGEVDMMKLLVGAGAKTDIRSVDGNNLVMNAADSGKLDAVEYALQFKPDLSATTDAGQTVLHLAIAKVQGNKEGEALLRLLVNQGAPLNAKNGQGRTPLEVAERGSAEGVNVIFEKIMKEHNVVASAGRPGG